MKLGVSEVTAYLKADSRRKHWFVSSTVAVQMALTKERMIHYGNYEINNVYQSM